MISSTTSAGWILSHVGGGRWQGSAEDAAQVNGRQPVREEDNQTRGKAWRDRLEHKAKDETRETRRIAHRSQPPPDETSSRP